MIDGRRYRTVSPEEAQRWVAEGEVTVLDVRTPDEYQRLGHIPGAILLPVNLTPAAAATLPRNGKPLLVCCEHGVRSAMAADLLARAGLENVSDLSGGMSCWSGPREHSPGTPYGPIGPASWLVENADLLGQGGNALDLACGRGRNALVLAAAGLSVRAIDRDPENIASLRITAERLDLPVQVEALDLEADGVSLDRGVFDLVVGIHYLHRPLFPALMEALRPGGLLLYETFTVDQAEHGHPKNPAFLLRHGELRELVAPLKVLRERDGEFDGRRVAGIVARSPAPTGRGNS